MRDFASTLVARLRGAGGPGRPGARRSTRGAADGGRETEAANAPIPSSPEALRAQELFYRAFVEQAHFGLVLADPKSGVLIEANPMLLARAGYTRADVEGLKLDDLFAPTAGSTESLTMQVRRATTGSLLHWYEKRGDGSRVEVEARCTLVTHEARDILALVMHDVSTRAKVEAQLIENQNRLNHLAHHDQLTGLPNRHYLAAFLPDAINEARVAQRELAILFIDLDHFKHVNDSRGHEAGDKLLQEVARRISANAGKTDTVVRMGGDEFVVVLRDLTDPNTVQQTARRINRALDQPIVVDGYKLVTTASIGVSLYPRDGADMGELLKHSDSAMYQAKETGRNQFQMFRVEMVERIKRRVTLEAALRAAVKANQFDVVYQPIIDLRLHRVAGLEALVRWVHPKHGLITPDKFVEVAEDSGLIVPIGGFVLRHVMQDLCAWRDQGLPLVPVSVNISPAQLKHGDLANVIGKLLSANRFEPSALELELTERAMFVANDARNGESKRDMIAELRNSGVRIAIDDFGTGYSSLSYLKQWRVDKLKIDRSFIRDVVTDPDDLAIVSAIFAIARQLRIEVIAEGIESHQQVQKLRPLGCRLGQGYLFAKPQLAEDCTQLLRSVSGAGRDEDVLGNMIDDTGRFGIPALFKEA